MIVQCAAVSCPYNEQKLCKHSALHITQHGQCGRWFKENGQPRKFLDPSVTGPKNLDQIIDGEWSEITFEESIEDIEEIEEVQETENSKNDESEVNVNAK